MVVGFGVLLNAVDERHALLELFEPLITAKASPALGRTLPELERQTENRVTTHAASSLGGSQSHRGKGRLDRVGRADGLPVRTGKIVEREQLGAVFGQAINGLRIFVLIRRDKGVKGVVRVGAGLGHPDRLQGRFGFGLAVFRQLVQNVGGLVYPASLVARGGINLGHRFPEAQRAVTDRQLRRSGQPLAIA